MKHTLQALAYALALTAFGYFGSKSYDAKPTRALTATGHVPGEIVDPAVEHDFPTLLFVREGDYGIGATTSPEPQLCFVHKPERPTCYDAIKKPEIP